MLDSMIFHKCSLTHTMKFILGLHQLHCWHKFCVTDVPSSAILSFRQRFTWDEPHHQLQWLSESPVNAAPFGSSIKNVWSLTLLYYHYTGHGLKFYFIFHVNYEDLGFFEVLILRCRTYAFPRQVYPANVGLPDRYSACFCDSGFPSSPYVFDISNEAKVLMSYVPENFADEKFWCRHYAHDILP
jgi:hypothetical protein